MTEQIISDLDDYWTSLIWLLAGDDKTQYDALKHGEVFEFFRLLKIHENNQIRKLKELEKRNKK